MPVLPQQRALDTQIPAEVQLEPSDVLWKDRRGQCLVLRAQTPLTMLGRCIIPSLPKKNLLARISLQLPLAPYFVLSIMRQGGKKILLAFHPALQLLSSVCSPLSCF